VAAIIQQNYVILSALVGVGTLIAFLIIYIRIISRLLIVELPLAIENNIRARSAIGRSWELTKGSVGRIVWIVIVAFLVSLPLGIVGQIVTGIVRRVVFSKLFAKSGLFYLVYYLLIWPPLSVGDGSLVIPFWQAMKAIIYYDLRSRKEGLGLPIRDR